ncbi:SMI1 / KNR4 family (SUKH-1) [Chitinophaga sp. YR627]|uniref:SMI1/KNR4 family protein n=1 Tax=Chitinophaga sp. YR627 TaxID=1881041 RepID=UPI0008EDCFE3|nr:SMI1/KNR4 family protein [Chitinophaga sp. YR627]SFO57464.1 SMI1 / KNR4 family (SUKH-1) [Chitinophaga sp. YR627]
MDNDLLYLTAKLDKNPPIDKDSFDKALELIDCSFPPDYLSFMRKHNGCEGAVLNGQWLVLWPIQELLQYNEMYGASVFAPGLFLIGSNGGAIAYGIKKEQGIFFEVEFVYMEEKESIVIAKDFESFLWSLAEFTEGSCQYSLARVASDKDNRKRHEQDPSLKGMHLHEVHPILLGGDPIAAANKVPLKSDAHSQYTRWWKKKIEEISN